MVVSRAIQGYTYKIPPGASGPGCETHLEGWVSASVDTPTTLWVCERFPSRRALRQGIGCLQGLAHAVA